MNEMSEQLRSSREKLWMRLSIVLAACFGIATLTSVLSLSDARQLERLAQELKVEKYYAAENLSTIKQLESRMDELEAENQELRRRLELAN